ncbi:tetratricopeptide repeat protein [Candidatus Njordibacter sp. Uisw_039]|uniref:tetratricopeptide repeat protein n=1 Tax=Candidatus Njordibacter sp. Uisw_039 TaxID=3230972 RepID=UPI003D393003
MTLDEALKMGVEAHKAGQLQEADRLYAFILKAQPKHPDANHNMGVLSIDVGKIQEALQFFKTALEANPRIGQFWLSHIDALIKLGRIADAQVAFNQAKDKGAKGEAFDQLEKQLSESSANPQDPPSDQLQPIINLFTQRQLQQALSHAAKMLEKFPNSVVLYNIAGASNAELKQFDAAIDCFKQALKIKPGNAEAYNNIGNALMGKGDLEAAVGRYKQALKIKPSFAEAHNNMGNALNAQGEPGIAIESYEQALKINPDYAEAYNNMGIALNDKGDLEVAVDSYKKAVLIQPNYAEAYYNMGITLGNKGNPEAAIDSYSKALKINAGYAAATSNLLSLLTTYVPKKETLNPVVLVNEAIRKIDIKDITSNVICDDQIVDLFSKSRRYIGSYGLEITTKLDQTYRRNSVDMNCKRHISIFDTHDIIPELCFSCYKVQVEPRSVTELIKLFLVFNQLELNENNTRKCMVELRPNIPGFYKGLIYCTELKQANQISEYLDTVLKRSIRSGLSSKVKRGCSEYPLSFPNYKAINNSGPQLMNYNEEWRAIEEAHDRKKPIHANKNRSPSLSGLNLSDVLIIEKWVDYARGIGDPSANLINQNPVTHQGIYDQARARLDTFDFIN